MIKKFVSGALLSVVMDKDARGKLARIKAAQSADSGEPKAKAARRTPPAEAAAEAAPARAEDAPRSVRVRSPAAGVPAAAERPGGGEDSGGEDGDPLALIESAVAAARRSLRTSAAPKAEKAAQTPAAAPETPPKAPGKTASPPAAAAAHRPAGKPAAAAKAAGRPKGAGPRAPDPGAPGSERERLISKALEIHAEKSRLLDELAPGLKDKLRLMALKQLDPQAYEEILRGAAQNPKQRAPR